RAARILCRSAHARLPAEIPLSVVRALCATRLHNPTSDGRGFARVSPVRGPSTSPPASALALFLAVGAHGWTLGNRPSFVTPGSAAPGIHQRTLGSPAASTDYS